MNQTFDEFMARFDPDGTRVIANITAERDTDGNSPFVVVRHGRFTAVLALMPFDSPGGHLCIDVHPFADGQDATAGVFGMTVGKRHMLPDTGTTSHGWPSAHLVSVLIGEQALADPDPGPPDENAPHNQDITEALIREARGWIADCFEDVDVASLSDFQVREGIEQHYVGGWEAFVEAGAALTEPVTGICKIHGGRSLAACDHPARIAELVEQRDNGIGIDLAEARELRALTGIGAHDAY